MKSWRNHWPALWLLLILALVAVVRVRLLTVPLERDEGEYAYAGQLMLQGEPPYRLVYNMKMPGIYAAYAVIMAVFGQSPAGIRLGFMLVNFGAIILMYFVGRRFLDRAGALAASAAYALLSVSPRVQGFNAHATHFVALAALGAILALLRAQERGRLAGFFWSGALFGLAFLMKQPGGAFAFFGGSMILWTAWRAQPPDWRRGAAVPAAGSGGVSPPGPTPGGTPCEPAAGTAAPQCLSDTLNRTHWRTHGWRLAVYAAGVAAPIVLTGLMVCWAGVWDKFWWWTVIYARVHATALAWAAGKARLLDYFTTVYWDGLFWGLALAGLCCVLLGKGRADEKFFFSSLSFFSIASVCPTLNFSGHYFVLMLPVVALLSAKVFATLAAWLAAQPLAFARGSPWILFGLLWAGVFWFHRGAFFEWSPEECARRMYPSNDFQVYPVIADYLRSHTSPTSTFAVLGSEPELLFYAHRRSVTGYIYMYDLVEEQPYRQRMEKEMISEVERGHPDYVVFVNLVFSWLPFPPDRLETIRKWMMDYTESQYEPFGVVTFPPNQYVWGPDCFKQVPFGHRFVIIFQRKQPGTNPPPSKIAP